MYRLLYESHQHRHSTVNHESKFQDTFALDRFMEYLTNISFIKNIRAYDPQGNRYYGESSLLDSKAA